MGSLFNYVNLVGFREINPASGVWRFGDMCNNAYALLTFFLLKFFNVSFIGPLTMPFWSVSTCLNVEFEYRHTNTDVKKNNNNNHINFFLKYTNIIEFLLDFL